MNKISLALIVTTLLAVGCSDSDKKEVGDFKDSYDFTENGCNTSQSFSAKTREELREKVCAGLVDDELNKGCALTLRAEKFNRECDGTAAQKNLGGGNGSDQNSQNQPTQPLPSQEELQKQAEEEQAAKLFSQTLANGEKEWMANQLKLVIKVKDLKSNKTTTIKSLCDSKTPIKLKASYPSLDFTIGFMECDKDLPSGIELRFFQLFKDMSYSIRQLPNGNPKDQFQLILESRPQLYLPSGTAIEDVQSLNGLVRDGRVFMDIMVTTQSVYLLPTDYLSYYGELEINPVGGELKEMRASLLIRKYEMETEVTLSGRLK